MTVTTVPTTRQRPVSRCIRTKARKHPSACFPVSFGKSVITVLKRFSKSIYHQRNHGTYVTDATHGSHLSHGSHRVAACLTLWLLVITPARPAACEAIDQITPPAATAASPPPPASSPAATARIDRTIARLVHGGALDAKLRMRVWVQNREVVGVGRYEQAGRGTGRFAMQMSIHDGSDQHTLQQISDGKLLWKQQQIGAGHTLERTNVGRLDQWRAETTGGREERLPPSTRIGGLVEILEDIAATHVLKLAGGKLDDVPVWILSGQRRDPIAPAGSVDPAAAELVPTRVVVVIDRDDETANPVAGLPRRIEYWSDPLGGDQSLADGTPVPPTRRLISLLELHAVRSIRTPPPERFQFNPGGASPHFADVTDRYLDRFGIRLSERQARTLRR